ncbi:MAG: tRNA adenosine(34) deaminase TadA [Euryarchaeota archaeon]|nr:tRNA adenosine(34) deaminase TadA [Thermodesulfobacteriota bacterium]MEA2035443.1 tRNA adenosine(34) deaminase TadA [Euryarchaeota archaeon]
MKNNDEKFIRLAIEEAKAAYAAGEVPVGAVITRGNDILARAHNRSILMNDPSAHAEIVAIRRAGDKIGNYRLAGTTLYVTLEPCIMCAGAIIQARISRVVFGTDDPQNGGVISLYGILDDKRLNHSAEITCGILKDECAGILGRFFREKRIKPLTL